MIQSSMRFVYVFFKIGTEFRVVFWCSVEVCNFFQQGRARRVVQFCKFYIVFLLPPSLGEAWWTLRSSNTSWTRRSQCYLRSLKTNKSLWRNFLVGCILCLSPTTRFFCSLIHAQNDVQLLGRSVCAKLPVLEAQVSKTFESICSSQMLAVDLERNPQFIDRVKCG